MIMRRLGVTVLIAGFVLCQTLSARMIRAWLLPDIFKASDLVVLAQVKQVEDGPTKKRILNGQVLAQEKRATIICEHLFKVPIDESKRPVSLTETKVKWYEPLEFLVDGPTGFQPEVGGHYIFFLRRELGLQRFVAVTGEDDPGIYSFLISKRPEPPSVPEKSDTLESLKSLLEQSDRAVSRFQFGHEAEISIRSK